MREIISQRDPGDEDDYKEIAMTELEKQIEESEERIKQATNVNKTIPLILKNQIAIMKRLKPEPSLNVWPPRELKGVELS